jgi:hypothetical protein
MLPQTAFNSPARAGGMRLALPLIVVVAVLFFACSGSGGDETAPRAQLRTPQPPASRGTQPVVSAPAALAPPAASPRPAVPASPSGAVEGVPAAQAQGPVTFGTVPEEAESQAPRLTAPRRPMAGGSRVFSNKDLASYRAVKEEFGFRDDIQRVDLTRPAAEAPAKESLTADEREREMSQTRTKITTLLDELQYLQKRIPSLHNPLLPRAKLSDADASAEAGLDNAERLARVNQRIGEVNGEMGTLQRRLAELTAMTPSDRPAGAARAD